MNTQREPGDASGNPRFQRSPPSHFPCDSLFYRVLGAINQPKGVQQPPIPLLIGGSGEPVTLKLVAQYADVYDITNPDVATLEHKLAVLKKHWNRYVCLRERVWVHKE